MQAGCTNFYNARVRYVVSAAGLGDFVGALESLSRTEQVLYAREWQVPRKTDSNNEET